MNASHQAVLATWIGLSIGNFVWQAMRGSHDWGQAAERSFFQGVALLAVVLLQKVWR